MIICDCCGKNVTPREDEEDDRTILKINGKKICLCLNCLLSLEEFACSEEHRKKTNELRAIIEQE